LIDLRKAADGLGTQTVRRYLITTAVNSSRAITYKALAKQLLNGQRGFQTQFDAHSQAWHLCRAADGAYIGCDDPRAVLLKGACVRDKVLAGLFAWELSQDNGDIAQYDQPGPGARSKSPTLIYQGSRSPL
jgi:GH18 family chitinase